jgi:SAM-dependent methyltransferase
MAQRTDYAAHDARYQALRAAGAEGWDTPEQFAERVPELTWILDALAPLADKRVLEIGCGAGNVAALLAARGLEVVGVDISPTAIAWATERASERTRFVVGDVVREIPVDGLFDAVLDGHCLHCIIGPDRARLLANVRAKLRPGGVLLVATMCGAITSPEIAACFDPISRCQIVDGVARRYIGEPDAILDELRAAGFAVERSLVLPRPHDRDQDELLAVARVDAPA